MKPVREAHTKWCGGLEGMGVCIHFSGREPGRGFREIGDVNEDSWISVSRQEAGVPGEGAAITMA